MAEGVLGEVDVQVWSPGLVRTGWVGDPQAVSVTPRWLAAGSATLALMPDDPTVPLLRERGARVTVDWRGQRTLSGRVGRVEGTGPHGLVTVTVGDDWQVLDRALGWPVPAGHATPTALDDPAQDTGVGDGGHYLTSGATSEDHILGLITANLTRLGVPVSVPASLGRGLTDPEPRLVRLTTISATVAAMAREAGLAVRVVQRDTGLAVEVEAVRTHADPLTDVSGQVASWSWSQAEPTATRVLVGGPGEQGQRALRLVIDAAREAEWHMVAEVLRDATGAQLVWPEDVPEEARIPAYHHLLAEASEVARVEAYYAAAAQAALDEGAPRSGLSVVLNAITPYGTDGLLVGDRVTVAIEGQELADHLEAVTLSASASAGLVVEHAVGGWPESPEATLARAVAALGRAQTRTVASR